MPGTSSTRSGRAGWGSRCSRGYGRAWRRTPQYLNRGLFTFYIIHQPALLLIIHWLKKADLSVGLEAPTVILTTMLSCILAYELARRSGWLAPFLGQRPGPRHPLFPGLGAPAPAAASSPA